MERSFTTSLMDEAGYSLVEVTVAMVVLTVAIIPLVGVLEAGLRAAAEGGRYDAARALAHGELEEARGLPYNAPGGAADSAVERYAPPGPPGGTAGRFTYAVETEFVDEELAPVGSPTGQMRVDVTVTWEGGSYAGSGLVSGEPP